MANDYTSLVFVVLPPSHFWANFTSIYVKWYCVRKIRFAIYKKPSVFCNNIHIHTPSTNSWMKRIEISIRFEKKGTTTTENSCTHHTENVPNAKQHTEIQFLCIFFGWLSLLLDFFFTISMRANVSLFFCCWMLAFLFSFIRSFDGKIQSLSDIYVFTFPKINVRVRYWVSKQFW